MKKTVLITAALGTFVIAGGAGAGVIDGWNMDTVVTDPPVYEHGETYYSTIYTEAITDDADPKPSTNGLISWEEDDTLAPGLQVVNNDDVNGSNCIMTSGINPYDGFLKQCSDPFKSSKRFKLKNTANAPLDLTFNVSSGSLTTYKMLQKLTDVTGLSWSGFTIELGFMGDDGFVPSKDDDGLGFSDTQGNFFTSPVTTYESKEDIFSAYYSQGLAGPADKYHPDPGYFNPYERFSFGMIATEDRIVSDGISATYSNIFGQWLNAGAVPIAIFYDDDGDMGTDNMLVANCADGENIFIAGTHTGNDVIGFSCEGTWVTYVNGVPQKFTVPDSVYTHIEDAIAFGGTNPYYMDYIEDLANLGLTFWLSVDDISSWPTYDTAAKLGNFTIRYTPVPVDGDGAADGGAIDPTPTEELCDGNDYDADGLVDCADPDCDGVIFCGPEDKSKTCKDGIDNDSDGAIDCDDSDCAKKQPCR